LIPYAYENEQIKVKNNLKKVGVKSMVKIF